MIKFEIYFSSGDSFVPYPLSEFEQDLLSDMGSTTHAFEHRCDDYCILAYRSKKCNETEYFNVVKHHIMFSLFSRCQNQQPNSVTSFFVALIDWT